jgi:hypothetical protein
MASRWASLGVTVRRIPPVFGSLFAAQCEHSKDPAVLFGRSQTRTPDSPRGNLVWNSSGLVLERLAHLADECVRAERFLQESRFSIQHAMTAQSVICVS